MVFHPSLMRAIRTPHMSTGAPYEEYTRLFALASTPLEGDWLNEHQALVASLLVIICMFPR